MPQKNNLRVRDLFSKVNLKITTGPGLLKTGAFRAVNPNRLHRKEFSRHGDEERKHQNDDPLKQF